MERPYFHKNFIGMSIAKMPLSLEPDSLLMRSTQFGRQPGKQGNRRQVVGRNGRVQTADCSALWPLQDFHQHSGGKTAVARGRRHHYLPNKKCRWLRRDHITGNESYELLPLVGGNTRICEMRALQQIAVNGIQVERWAPCDQPINSDSIVGKWPAQENTVLNPLRIERSAFGHDVYNHNQY